MNTYNETMSFVDLLFPKFCLNCSFPGAYICLSCQDHLPYSRTSYCFFCKKRSLNSLTHINCLKKFNIDGVNFIFYYNSFLKKIIKTTKYRLATQVWQELTTVIKPEAIERLAFYKKLSGKVYFQPIPLSNRKIRERGFNQALLIAKFFKKYFKYPISDYLIRVKNTAPQAEMKTKKERYKNIRGAFQINQKQNIIKDSTIILVDDVITTGLTVIEAARVLKEAGVKKIYVLVVAKG